MDVSDHAAGDRPDRDRASWNERYGSAELVWSAEPNRFVPPEVAGLTPGRAVDVACGEGRNAIWLAQQGWDVVAVDFSDVAVSKGRRLAEEAGVRIEWVVADVTAYDPPPGADLVLVCYLQLGADALAAALRRAAASVEPGGTVVVIGHHVDNLERGYGGPSSREVLHDPALVAEVLAGAGLAIRHADLVERPVETTDGVRTALDSLVRAERPATPVGGRTIDP